MAPEHGLIVVAIDIGHCVAIDIGHCPAIR